MIIRKMRWFKLVSILALCGFCVAIPAGDSGIGMNAMAKQDGPYNFLFNFVYNTRFSVNSSGYGAGTKNNSSNCTNDEEIEKGNPTDLIITGVIDGTLCSKPRAIELYAPSAIANLSMYGLGVANGSAGSDGKEFTFPAEQVAAGTFFYVAFDAGAFKKHFGLDPTYTNSLIKPQGGDAIELFRGDTVIDVFGDPNLNGTDQAWTYTDGWAYSKSGRHASASFNEQDWIYSDTEAISKRCPPSHPFAYVSGSWCCAVQKGRSDCDPGVLTFTSRCCFRNQNCVCPSKPCQNYYDVDANNEIVDATNAQNPDREKLFNTWFPYGTYTRSKKPV